MTLSPMSVEAGSWMASFGVGALVATVLATGCATLLGGGGGGSTRLVACLGGLPWNCLSLGLSSSCDLLYADSGCGVSGR